MIPEKKSKEYIKIKRGDGKTKNREPLVNVKVYMQAKRMDGSPKDRSLQMFGRKAARNR